MISLLSVIAFLLLASAVCYALLGMRLARYREVAGSLPMGLTFIAIGIWVLGGSVEMFSSSYNVFSLGRLGHFVGTALVPVGMLICFRSYTGSHTGKLAIAALLVVPALSITVAATNQLHQLMWLLPATNAAGEFLTRPLGWGPWFTFVHAPYGYMIVGVSILTLVLHSSAVAPAHRRGLMILAGSAVAPIIASISYDLGLGPDTISTLPLVFAAMLPIFAWLVLAEQIIEYTPIAYETVFQHMQDPVIVIDDRERIVSLNAGAEKLLQVSEKNVHRSTLESVFGEDVPEVHEAL